MMLTSSRSRRRGRSSIRRATGFSMTIRILHQFIFRNIEETNSVHIKIENRRIHSFHFHSHLHLFYRLTHGYCLKLLAVGIINHFHIVMLTSSRSRSSNCRSRSWSRYRHRKHSRRVSMNNNIIRNIIEFNIVHIIH